MGKDSHKDVHMTVDLESQVHKLREAWPNAVMSLDALSLHVRQHPDGYVVRLSWYDGVEVARVDRIYQYPPSWQDLEMCKTLPRCGKVVTRGTGTSPPRRVMCDLANGHRNPCGVPFAIVKGGA